MTDIEEQDFRRCLVCHRAVTSDPYKRSQYCLGLAICSDDCLKIYERQQKEERREQRKMHT
jgi:predicted nucleic acid-binding Zn ribbon protein